MNYIISQGGTAYLPEPMVRHLVEENVLHHVKDAPVIDRIAYAVINQHNTKQALIKHALDFFELPENTEIPGLSCR